MFKSLFMLLLLVIVIVSLLQGCNVGCLSLVNTNATVTTYPISSIPPSVFSISTNSTAFAILSKEEVDKLNREVREALQLAHYCGNTLKEVLRVLCNSKYYDGSDNKGPKHSKYFQ